VAEEIARLGKENAALREQMARMSQATALYNGISFDELYKLLVNTKVDVTAYANLAETIRKVAEIFGDPEPGLLHMFWVMRDLLARGKTLPSLVYRAPAQKAEDFGLVFRDNAIKRYFLSESGKQFLLRLRLERNTEDAESYVI
jgi:hypothetical protein